MSVGGGLGGCLGRKKTEYTLPYWLIVTVLVVATVMLTGSALVQLLFPSE